VMSTLLIVEDNVILAKSISRWMRQHGIAVHSVKSTVEAISWISEYQPTAVLVDLLLQDGHGLDFVERHIRPRFGNLPVVVITGTGTESDLSKAKELGVVAFLGKPFPLSDLANHLLPLVQGEMQ
jgi:DNA-binding NtrC family response regulator